MSNNYPQNYGNRERCTVSMTQNARLEVQSPFFLERNFDFLRVNGSPKWSPGQIPTSLTSGSTIEWSTDGSVTKTGWKICFSEDNNQFTTVEPTAGRSYTRSEQTFVRWNSCDQRELHCRGSTSEACVQQGTSECNRDSNCVGFSVRRRVLGGFDDIVLYDGQRSCLEQNAVRDSHWDHFLLNQNAERAIGNDVLTWNILEHPSLSFTMNAFALIGALTIVATIGKFALHKYHASNYKEIQGDEEI